MGADRHAAFENVALEGPDNPGTSVYTLLLHQAGAGSIRLKNCRTSMGTLAVKMDGGPALLECTDCELSAGSTVMLCSDSGGGGGRVHLFNCTFNTQRSHCAYINTGVSVLIDGCVFESSDTQDSSYGLHYFGGSGTPQYAMVRNCLFLEGVRNHIVTNANYRITIQGCEFRTRDGVDTSGVRVDGGGVILTGCRFVGDADYQLMDFGATAEVLAIGCEFDGRGKANVYRSRGHVAPWRFVNCSFRNGRQGEGHCVRAEGTTDLEFTGCRFLEAPSGNDSHYVKFSDGSLALRDCRVAGNKSIWVTGRNPDEDTKPEKPAFFPKVSLYNNTFESSDGGDGLFVQNLVSDWNLITLHGSDNRFIGNSGGPNISGNVKGYLRPPSGIGPLLTPHKNAPTPPPPGMSTYTLTIPPSNSTFPMSGAEPHGVTKIKFIQIQGINDATKAFHGPFHLIASRKSANDFLAWQLLDNGNIRPKKVAVREEHEVATLIYDVDAGLWLEL